MSVDNHLLRQQEYNLKRNTLRLEILHEISLSLARLTRPEQVANQLLNLLPGIFDIRACAVYLTRENGTHHCVEALGISREDLQRLPGVWLTRARRSSGALAYHQARYLKPLGFHEVLIAPLVSNNEQFGLLLLFDREARNGVIPFTAEDVRFVESLASIAAVALHNGKLYLRVLDEKLEKEAIFNSAPVAIIATDSRGRIMSYNQAAEARLGFCHVHVQNQMHWTKLIAGIPTGCPYFARNIAFRVPAGKISGDISIVPLFDHAHHQKGMLITIQDLSEALRLREMFQRYVSEAVVSMLLKEPERMKLGGEKRQVTVLYTDLRGFTPLSTQITPEQTVWMLNEYFAVMVGILHRFNGTVDKIIGDGLMALFGAPVSLPDEPATAVNCAFELMRAMKGVNANLQKRSLPSIAMGIGIDCGTCIAGNIGSPNMMTYTVIGNTANLSNRLCGKALPNEILISERVYASLTNKSAFHPTEPILLKGLSEPIVTYSSLNAGLL